MRASGTRNSTVVAAIAASLLADLTVPRRVALS